MTWRDRRRQRRHRLLEADLRDELHAATGDRFDEVRARLLEVVLCTDPLSCDHVR